MKKLSFLLILVSTSFIYSQELDSIASMDKDFLDSLPESVRADVMSEMKDRGDSDNLKNLQRRPSTEISKLETIKNWENRSSRFFGGTKDITQFRRSSTSTSLKALRGWKK